AGAVDQADGIVVHGPAGDLFSLELPPGLVKGYPYYYGREIIERVHDRFPFGAEDLFRFRAALPFRADARNARTCIPLIAHVPAWHILPYQHAQLVAMVIPAGRFHLHMLADHIKTHFLRLDDVKKKSFVARRGIEA